MDSSASTKDSEAPSVKEGSEGKRVAAKSAKNNKIMIFNLKEKK
jgi:hypothetical protein